MESGDLLEMHHITKEFPGVLALNNVHFKLAPGEIHALLGENGAGKSTLIKVLTGAETLTQGNILLNGREITVNSPLHAQNQGISTVYQEVNLCPNLSVAENIYIGREPLTAGGRIDWKTMQYRSRELLGEFDIDIDVTVTLDNYSVAIQQMVAIARSCDISAKVLILDEPTSSLTEGEVIKLFETMRRLRDQGMGIVFVTHFLDQVYEVCDRITVLRNGEYICTERCDELSRIDLISRMIGKDFSAFSEESSSSIAAKEKEPFLVAEKMWGSNRIKPFDLELFKGEILGFAGLLGSGRSEMARLLFGADKRDGGNLKVRGRDISFTEPSDAIREGIAFCPEDRKAEGIIGELSIRENIILALQSKRGMTRPIRYNEACRIADRFIKLLSIKTPGHQQLIRNLSGGNQQKVILARWLAAEPELLILDEPTRGIDVGTKLEIQKLMKSLAGDGMSVLFISSEIDEMMRCCQRMVVLREREKTGELAGQDLTETRLMRAIAGDEI